MGSALMEVRAALKTTTSNNWAAGTIGGGAEIQHLVQEIAINAFNNVTDFAKMLRRENMSQLAYIWNLTKESTANGGAANSSFAFYAGGGTGTVQATSKQQLIATALAYRTDYAVDGIMIASGMGNQLLQEAIGAAESHAIGEERAIICGTNTSAYGFASSFLGLLQLMSTYVTFQTTLEKYGKASAASTEWMDVQHVNAAGTIATTTKANLSLAKLDEAITKSNKRGGKGHRRIFFCSEERGDEIEQLLQAQQRFNTTGSSIEFDGGIRIMSYKYVPIVRSRFMDKNGILYDGTNATWANHYTNDDGAMYLLDLNYIKMVHVAGVNAAHVPIMGSAGGSTTSQAREDVEGGYFKSYGVLVFERFDTHVLISNLNTL